MIRNISSIIFHSVTVDHITLLVHLPTYSIQFFVFYCVTGLALELGSAIHVQIVLRTYLRSPLWLA